MGIMVAVALAIAFVGALQFAFTYRHASLTNRQFWLIVAVLTIVSFGVSMAMIASLSR